MSQSKVNLRTTPAIEIPHSQSFHAWLDCCSSLENKIESYQGWQHEIVIYEQTSSIDLSRQNSKSDRRSRQDEGETRRRDDNVP